MTSEPEKQAGQPQLTDDNRNESIQLDAEHPWPGLASYDEAASRFFFGRTDEAREMLRMVRLSPLTLLYGKSGLGKTSLLQAGFFPLLRAEHYFPVHLRLDYSPSASLPPLQQAAAKLRSALHAAHIDCTPWPDTESLWQYLHRRDLEIWSTDNFPLTPVLVFDQFEEIFSHGGTDTQRIRSNLNALADLIENRIPSELTDNVANRKKKTRLDLMARHYRIVLAFREDFLPEMESWKEQVPSLFHNRLRLLPMNRTRAIEAVSSAGAAVLAADTAQPLVDFVGNLDGRQSHTTVIEPVLLSLCCYQLNLRRTPGGKINTALLQQAGQNILQDFYDEALSGLPQRVSEFIETHLIQGDRYRGSYPVEQAVQDGFITREQLSVLADKYRLLRIDQHMGVNRVELIHDRLVSIVRKARDKRLRQIEDERLRKKEQETQRQIAFEKLNRLARKLRIALGVAVSLTVVAIYGWTTASIEKQRAFLAQSSLRVVSESLDMANGTRIGGDERAMLQLLAINQVTPNPAVDSAILTVLAKKNATQKLWKTGERITSIAMNPQGTHIATVSTGNTLQLWHRDGQLIGMQSDAHPCHSTDNTRRSCGITQVLFSLDGNTIVTTGQDATLRLWDAETLHYQDSLSGHTDTVTGAAFSPDGQHIVSASLDDTLRIWDIRSRQTVVEQRAHSDGVTSVVYSPDGNRIVSGGHDNTLQVWTAQTLQPIEEPLRGHKAGITAVAYSSSGSKIASVSQDKTLRLWDAHTLTALNDPLLGHEDIIWDVTFSPDDSLIVTAGHDRTLRIWETAQYRPDDRPGQFGRVGRINSKTLRGHEESVMAVTFRPDGNAIISGSRDTSLRLWDAHDNQPINTQLKGGHKNFVASVAYSPDGQYIVSGSDDATVQLWDAETGNTVGNPMKAHTGSLNGVAFSPDGKWIVSGASDKMVCLWETETQTLIAKLTGHEDGVESVAFSPDGNTFASGSKDNTVRLWDRRGKRAIGRPLAGHDGMVRGVAFSPDGSVIASASYDGTVGLWQVATGKRIAKLDAHEAAVTSVAFSSDGGRLVSGSKDNTVIIWDFDTRQPTVEPLRGHEERVNSVAFSPDGQRIVSGSSDTTLRLWDSATGNPIGNPMNGHELRINSVSFNPQGTRIVSGSDDMTLRIWPAHNDWSQQLCNKLTRNMTQTEWRLWISAKIDYQKQCLDLAGPLQSD